MSCLSSRFTRRAAALVLFAFTSTAGFSTPSLAIDGRAAVNACIDSTAGGARCAWSVNDEGEIDICNKNGCITCPSATEECTMALTTPTAGQGSITGTFFDKGTLDEAPSVDLAPIVRAPSGMRALQVAP
jgi:hypothetical protein